MREVEKSKRLSQIAAFVRRGSFVADVGTDHAYLPIYLVQKGIVQGAVAADVVQGPLRQAEKNIARYKLEDKIQVVCSDGLQSLDRDKIDDVVIAGMGGELIASILQKGNWTDRDKNFILQPMTMEPYLRGQLWETGYEIVQEQAVAQGRHVYTVMQVVYSGVIRQSDPYECAVGLIEKKLGDGERYLLREKKRAEDRCVGAGHSGDEQMMCYWEQVQEKIQKLLEESK